MRRLAVAALVLSALAAGVLTACAAPGPPTDPGSTPRGTTTAPSPGPTGRPVSFPATDGVTLSGEVYGTGPTAVVLSNMGDNDPGPWQQFAPLLAARGYTVLTYSFRYPENTNAFTPAMAAATVPDLRGAVAYVQAQGARRVVLIGASLGGITVGKVAGAVKAVSAVVMSAEQDLVGYGLTVTPADLAAMTMPKLFVASQDDTNTPYADTAAYYQHAPDPKQFHTFPGGTHGVRVFATDHGDELRTLLLDFVTSTAPTT